MNTGSPLLNPSLIPEEALTQIQGGLFFEVLFPILEIPHILIGFREFYNYAVDRQLNGCIKIEPGDYFSDHICSCFT